MNLTEKYRPQNLNDVVGQDKYVEQLRSMASNDKRPHVLLFGPAGCGKTSLAYAYAKETGRAIFELNASDERGIDTIRMKVKEMSKMGGERIIFLDEADALTSPAQHALRRIMERSNQQFILTGNDQHKIINPIKSRCVTYYLNSLGDRDVLKIVLRVLQGEGYKRENIKKCVEAIKFLVKQVKGDARKALNYLEPLITGELDITLANLKANFPSLDAVRIMREVYEGNWEIVTNELEGIKNLDIDMLYTAIGDIDLPKHIKIKLYEKLGEIEANINYGASPTVQFTSFLASLWVSKYVEKRNE